MPTAAELRQATIDLSTLAAADLRRLWREVDTAEAARDALIDVLPALIDTYGLAASAVAADWYDELRDELEIPGRFTAVPVEPRPETGESLAKWAVDPLFQPEPDWHRAQVLVEGGLQLRIAGVVRDTVTGSSVRDPQAQGWQRAGLGSCPFCAMLIGRGAVYSQATAGFASHDNCKCVAVPAFNGHPVPVKPYTPSSRTITDADRARVREYLAANSAG